MGSKWEREIGRRGAGGARASRMGEASNARGEESASKQNEEQAG